MAEFQGRVALVTGPTVAGPLVVLVGVAMLVLPGPGLVVIALGLALLALEYEWARGLVGALELHEHLLPPAGQHDGRAFLQEARDGRLPDPSATAGDDRDLAFEPAFGHAASSA